MIEEIVSNIERLFKELLIELKSGNIEVKKAKEVEGFNPELFKQYASNIEMIFIIQFLILLIQIYMMFKK